MNQLQQLMERLKQLQQGVPQPGQQASMPPPAAPMPPPPQGPPGRDIYLPPEQALGGSGQIDPRLAAQLPDLLRRQLLAQMKGRQ